MRVQNNFLEETFLELVKLAKSTANPEDLLELLKEEDGKYLSYKTSKNWRKALMVFLTVSQLYSIYSLLLISSAPNTYSFPVFTPNFCGTLVEELKHFELTDLPKGRPNTMNRGGVRRKCEVMGEDEMESNCVTTAITTM